MNEIPWFNQAFNFFMISIILTLSLNYSATQMINSKNFSKNNLMFTEIMK